MAVERRSASPHSRSADSPPRGLARRCRPAGRVAGELAARTGHPGGSVSPAQVGRILPAPRTRCDRAPPRAPKSPITARGFPPRQTAERPRANRRIVAHRSTRHRWRHASPASGCARWAAVGIQPAAVSTTAESTAALFIVFGPLKTKLRRSDAAAGRTPSALRLSSSTSARARARSNREWRQGCRPSHAPTSACLRHRTRARDNCSRTHRRQQRTRCVERSHRHEWAWGYRIVTASSRCCGSLLRSARGATHQREHRRGRGGNPEAIGTRQTSRRSPRSERHRPPCRQSAHPARCASMRARSAPVTPPST